MAITPATQGDTRPSDTSFDYRPALALLASLFFMWGFITVINNTLLPHLRSVFELNYTQTTLIESVWFIAYGVMGMPSAFLIERTGYKKAIIIGLCAMAAGALGMVPAAQIPSYGVTLFALFVIASGITLLQVAANPYVAVIGPAESSESRLTLVQAFNSFGTFLAPYFGGYLILSRTIGGTSLDGTRLTEAERLADAQATQLPYLLVAVVLLVIAVVLWRSNLPALGSATSRVAKEERKKLSLWKHRNLVLGVPAIFIYLIAEIGVANLFINFAILPEIAGITPAQAANYLVLLWGGMMVGRFAGSFIMRRFPADKTLAAFALFALVVMVGAATLEGPVAMWCLILVGLGHSIMFPAIFAMGIKGLGPLTEEGSGLLITAIAGGALVVVQGWLADLYGLQNSFWLTVACEVYIIYYALWGSRPTAAYGGNSTAEPA
ncbi:FHS family L-fucose permease-like MFS transporter [Altererythrobacter atlanticus]|uniref:L-fucose-proton symporter n=1 Tax=Croceibacterium atlanticum TaxID=1267766 RepID=A0A0F7KVQ8_9SPHN|nr:sugar MFS transporter [Croceibacterium atlanticum]AKH43251.1 L-fucose-proton symporter [Croceibacterium atlanticum]MBB5732043.1 FHS family L-fucose permease-like MFS transporter [Croceibacterium atlanticum]